MNQNREKKLGTPLKERNNNLDQDQSNLQKFWIDSVKKK